MGRRVTNGTVGSAGLGNFTVSGTTLVGPSNSDITLDPVGTGVLKVAGDTQLNAQGDLRFGDADSSNWVAFQGASTIASNVTWTLPATDGSNGQALTTNGSGTLSWSTNTVTVSDETTNATRYLSFTAGTSGTASTLYVSSTKFTVNPSTGVLTTVSITESSSIALKENINPIENALDSIMRLVGVTYDRRDGSKKEEAGLIAEEVDKILPNLVTKDQDGNPDAIHYTKLTAYLIEAVKSLKAEINSLKGI
jgi:hypothetical protein